MQDRIVIAAGPREITTHDREVEPRHRYVFRPEHRPPRGHGGKGHEREPFPEEKDLRRLLPEIEAYLGALKRRGKLQTTLALRQLLRMAREYPRDPLLAARPSPSLPSMATAEVGRSVLVLEYNTAGQGGRGGRRMRHRVRTRS